MRWWCVVPTAVAAVGCADPVADTRIPDDVLAQLRADMAMPQLDVCPRQHADHCEQLARLGQELFADPAMSGALTIDEPGIGSAGDVGKLACTTCHAPGYLIDPRGANAQSLGAKGVTKHNAISLANEVVRDALAQDLGSFGWTGVASGEKVFTDLALPKAMNGSALTVQAAVKNHIADYNAAGFEDNATNENTALENATVALDLYERRLISLNSPFDRFLAGDDHALTPQQQHGFELFVGPATCIECHHGPMLTDLQLHTTGIASNASEKGRQDDTGDPADAGLYLTASLRNVAMTAPYTHAGQLGSLRDVVDFYRRGGDDTGFFGTKDPRIVPLVELTDDDAADLVAFLESLTGDPIGDDLVGEPK